MKKFLLFFFWGVFNNLLYAQSLGDYRTNGNTNFSTATNWQRYNGSTWIAASAAPTNTDGVITIRNGHTATININVTLDQVVIEAGGILVRADATALTLNDGSGNDMTIFGTFRIQSGSSATNNNYADMISYSASAKILVKTGGTIEINTNAGGAHHMFAAEPITRIEYENGAVFYWNRTFSGAFATSNITYFPSVASSVVPIFRVNNTISVGAGGANTTTINGFFEVTSGNTVTWQNDATKTFRNGMGGAGNITQASGCGQFVISGTATFSGSGNITLNSINGLSFSSGITAALNSKTIGGTGPITVNANVTLRTTHSNGIRGNLTSSGTRTFNATANYVFEGTAAQNTGFDFTTGADVETMQNLTSTNANDVTLDRAITVNGVLTLSSGDLNLNGSDITFGTSATLSENRMAGYVVKDNSGTGRIIANNRAISGDIAGLGLGITNSGALSVNLIRGHSQQTGEAPDYYQGIKKWFDITVASGTVSSASLSFYYADDDFAAPATSAEEPYFKLYKKVGSAPWEGGFGTVNTASNVVTHTGISSFSTWTVGTSNAPLPVALVSFYAQANGNTAQLFWQTANEYENKGFEVQKSYDGFLFEVIGFVEGVGYSTIAQNYQFTDPTFFQDAYYRLRQIDARGTSQLSKVIFLAKENTDVTSFIAYPNPFYHHFQLASPSKDEWSANLIDVKGTVLFREKGTLKFLNERLAFFTEVLEEGTYLLHLYGRDGEQTIKIQKR